mmetsp:Transcript_21332/g.52540  ORF Transcript_21332/g.52540 Transcript_21332/m.52540 type:complete len:215 (-) Transcript_21332:2205-2849(-)
MTHCSLVQTPHLVRVAIVQSECLEYSIVGRNLASTVSIVAFVPCFVLGGFHSLHPLLLRIDTPAYQRIRLVRGRSMVFLLGAHTGVRLYCSCRCCFVFARVVGLRERENGSQSRVWMIRMVNTHQSLDIVPIPLLREYPTWSRGQRSSWIIHHRLPPHCFAAFVGHVPWLVEALSSFGAPAASRTDNPQHQIVTVDLVVVVAAAAAVVVPLVRG